jgi:hypothetical protein
MASADEVIVSIASDIYMMSVWSETRGDFMIGRMREVTAGEEIDILVVSRVCDGCFKRTEFCPTDDIASARTRVDELATA